MVTATQERVITEITVEEPTLREQIVEWLEAERRNGTSLRDAARAVVDRLIRKKQAAAFLEAFGVSVIVDLFQEAKRHHRIAALSSPGERRVNVDALKGGDSIMDTITYWIEGAEVSLGDMDKAKALAAKEDFEKQAEGNMRQAVFLGRVADGLRGRQTVRARYTVDELRALFSED